MQVSRSRRGGRSEHRSRFAADPKRLMCDVLFGASPEAADRVVRGMFEFGIVCPRFAGCFDCFETLALDVRGFCAGVSNSTQPPHCFLPKGVRPHQQLSQCCCMAEGLRELPPGSASSSECLPHPGWEMALALHGGVSVRGKPGV